MVLRLLCDELARRIDADVNLVEQVIKACRHAAEEHQRPNPADESRLKISLEKIKRGIDFTLKSPGDTEEDQANSMRVLRELRMDKARLDSEVRGLQTARKERPKVPTAKEVRKVMKELAKILTGASRSSDPEDRAALRGVIEELIDGPIRISQQGERKRQHGWLRGTLRLKYLSTVVNRFSNSAVVCDDEGIEISIDFKRPLKTDTKAEIAWQMHKDKKFHAEIAEALGGCCTSYVTKLLKYYADNNGLDWIDGRSLRLDFPHQNRKPALFKQIVNEVMVLYGKDTPIGEIATLCKVHPVTARKSIRWFHEQHTLKVPNGRTRAGRIKEMRNRRGSSS